VEGLRQGLETLPYAEIWAVDFEFGSKPGENPEPVCLVAWELRNGRKLRVWHDQFGTVPPYPTGSNSLFIAYYASAEISCHLALGWPVPVRVLDLFTEFRNRTNGVPPANGNSLLGVRRALGHGRHISRNSAGGFRPCPPEGPRRR
jgi:DNA polymerase I